MECFPKVFVVSDPPRVAAMMTVVEGLRSLLEALAFGRVPGPHFSRADLRAFCVSAVTGQRGSLGRTKPGSWSVAASDDGMPADARVDFVFTPTYAVVAILTKVLQDFPDVASKVPGFEEALRLGMEFASLRRLKGHGIEAQLGEADARRLLELGGVDLFLQRRPDFCPALANAFG